MESSDEEKFSPEKVVGGSKRENTKKASVGAMDHNDENSDSDSDLSDPDYVCSVCSKKFSGFIPFQQHEKGSKHAKALLKKKREKKLREKITVGEKVTENDEDYLFFIKKPYAVCKPCGKQFGGPESYALHVDSKAHKQKVLQASILNQVRDNGEINVDMLKEFYKSKITADDDAEDLLEDTQNRITSLKERDEDGDIAAGGEEFECKDCEKIFSGMIPYTQHVMSKVHAKAVEKKKLLQKILPEDVEHSTKSKVRDMSHLTVEDDILVCKLCSTSFSGPENAIQHLKSRNHSKNLEKYLRKQEKKQKFPSRVVTLSEKLPEDCSHQESLEESSDDETQQETAAVSKHGAKAPISVSSKSKFHTCSSSDQKYSATSIKDDSPKVVGKSKEESFSDSSNSSDSFSSDDDQQKFAITQDKEDSLKADIFSGENKNSPTSQKHPSSNNDKFPTVANPPNQMVGSEQRPYLTIKPDGSNKDLASEVENMDIEERTEEPQASNKGIKGIIYYEKYKEYKEIMKLARKDNANS